MMAHASVVEESLLRKFSMELEIIGKAVRLKTKYGETDGTVKDVLIIPVPEFYRKQFMLFYKANQGNGVKALKELQRNFPYAPDYQLDLGYLIEINEAAGKETRICARDEFERIEF